MKKMGKTQKIPPKRGRIHNGSGSKKPRTKRFYGPGGYVDRIFGEGSYAVQYSVCDSTGHLLQKKIPGSGDYCSIGRVKRFATINGAISFFLKKQYDGALPCIFLWKNRKATPMHSPTGQDNWGLIYEGGVKRFTELDLGNFFRKHGGHPYFGGGNYTDEMLVEAVKRKLLIK